MNSLISFTAFHSIVRMNLILFSHSPVEGHLSYFQFGATKDDLNVHLQVSLWGYVFISSEINTQTNVQF